MGMYAEKLHNKIQYGIGIILNPKYRAGQLLRGALSRVRSNSNKSQEEIPEESGYMEPISTEPEHTYM